MTTETFRKCPKCPDRWINKDEWEKNTEVVGVLEREHCYIIRHGKESLKTTIKVQLDVRRHRCGGEMYNEGVVMGESVEKYSSKILESPEDKVIEKS